MQVQRSFPINFLFLITPISIEIILITLNVLKSITKENPASFERVFRIQRNVRVVRMNEGFLVIERHERHLRQFPVATISKFYCQFVAPSVVFIERAQLSNFRDKRRLKEV